MRVFDSYYFNIIDKVKFKDTKPYLDKMLAETGFSYKGIAFALYSVVDDVRQKSFEKFPNLSKYSFVDNDQRNYGLTSYKGNWADGNIHADLADKADWNEIAAMFSKIPHTLNFSFGHLLMNGVNWFSDSTDVIAPNYKYTENYRNRLTEFPLFLSNSITHHRCYDDGKKLNRVTVCIDVTDKTDPRDSRAIIEKLVPYLGEPTNFKRECMFTEEENKKFSDLESAEWKKLKEFIKTALPESKKHKPWADPHIMPPPDPVIPHVADKFTLDKAFTDTAFKREKGQPNWLHLYSCVDEHGFRYEAYTQKLSGGNDFRIYVSISGYNFEVGTSSMDYYVTEEGESLEILKTFASFCMHLLMEYGGHLAELFGDTPKWYNEQ